MIFIGTRPEIIKMAPIIRKAEKYGFNLIVIHSGQHYDYQMSEVLLQDLELININENLEIGSGSHGYQTAKMIEKFEDTVLKYNPDVVLAQGDTNTVVAVAIVCSKLGIPFGHVEAGIRSFDMTMPEEINRRIASVGATFHFAPTQQSVLNLYYEGIDPERIFLTGNTIVDSTLENIEIAKKKSQIIDKLKLSKSKQYIIVTVHRPSNVDNKENLTAICESLISLDEFHFIFAIHPRTNNKLDEYNLKSKLLNSKNIILTEPLGYLDFISLLNNCKIIITDSGGIQEEAVILKKPCITLRTNTERPETVREGLNILVGVDSKKIIETVKRISKSGDHKNEINTKQDLYGKGDASQAILQILKNELKSKKLVFKKPVFFESGSAEYQLVNITKDSTREDIEKTYKGKITLVYDESGKPKPLTERILKNWYVRIQN
ncbi:MAG: UDP-N-acetylglucosamine 2-epimerase (non-hydrolyzing) [Candidatus Heimdallarchaeota archaeon]